MELNKNNMLKILGIVTFAIVLVWVFLNLTIVGNFFSFIFGLIFPFLLGLCIAFVLNVPTSILERAFTSSKKKKNQKITKPKKWIRPLCITISLLILLLIIFFVFFLVVPELIRTFILFKDNIPNIVQTVQYWYDALCTNYPQVAEGIANFNFDLDHINSEFLSFMKTAISGIFASSITMVINFILGVVNFFIAIIFAFYILLQKEKLGTQFKKFLYAYFPSKFADGVLNIGKISNKIFTNFISGQVLEAFILGVLCFIGMLILQIPYALTISVLVGVTALIPIFGAFIGVAVGVILIVVTSPIKALIFIIFFIVLQQIEGNLIYPKVVGNSVGLPPMWVMLAIMIGGSTFGILGMLISVPISSILYVLLREATNMRLSKKQLTIE